ncbi:hypothetical protein EYF80_053759 [Liparis tanakae]|uniref:Uncharacterized protein n=1 Tax=Liparis tanakae TaxID=230148 RepID=A0A4Z2F6U1_9TELE|nr:hypothetical protein EYF80_053759 [Liparis tanakae]
MQTGGDCMAGPGAASASCRLEGRQGDTRGTDERGFDLAPVGLTLHLHLHPSLVAAPPPFPFSSFRVSGRLFPLFPSSQ